jgi:hypothetical protein
VGHVHLRAVAAAGALGLGLLAASPAAAATGHQAAANALTLQIADQGGQGTGTFTATYADGHQTTSGTSEPPFSDPSGQKNLTGGVLAQEATARPNFSAACAGLAGDGGSVVNIGDSSCLKPGNLLTGSFGSFDPSTLVPSSLDPSQLNQLVNQVPGLSAALGQITGQAQSGSDQLTSALDQALNQAKSAVGDGGLVVNLDMVDGRCTASNGSTTGDADLTNAKVQFIAGTQKFTLLDFKPHPAPNTHVFTNLQKVADAIVDSFKSSLTESLQGNAQLSAALSALQTQVIDKAASQLQANLGPLEQNLLDITLNQQVHPTPHSIKVRALNVDLLPAAKSQLSGHPLANLQIGNAACAPVETAKVLGEEARRPAARTSPHLRTPTAVDSGLESVPAAQDHGIARSTWALLALGGLGLTGAGLVAARRLFG